MILNVSWWKKNEMMLAISTWPVTFHSWWNPWIWYEKSLPKGYLAERRTLRVDRNISPGSSPHPMGGSLPGGSVSDGHRARVVSRDCPVTIPAHPSHSPSWSTLALPAEVLGIIIHGGSGFRQIQICHLSRIFHLDDCWGPYLWCFIYSKDYNQRDFLGTLFFLDRNNFA